jgi:hypothetical protein
MDLLYVPFRGIIALKGRDYVIHLTREQITFAIALVGFLLSLWNFFRDLKANRKSISVCIPCTIALIDSVFLKMVFVNNSRQPISVTRLQISFGNDTYDLGVKRIHFHTYLHPELRGKTGEATTTLPVHLDPLGFSACTFQFFGQGIPSGTEISLVINTNRGVIRKSLSAPEPTADVLSFLQYLE